MLLLADIDECAELDDVCRDGRCSNTFGSFLCVCPDGYTLDDSQRACIGKLYLLPVICQLSSSYPPASISFICDLGARKHYRGGWGLQSTKSQTEQENHETGPSSPFTAFFKSTGLRIVAMDVGRWLQLVDVTRYE